MDRDQLEQKLRQIITGCEKASGECDNCHCTGNAAVYRVMIAIDAYTIDLGLLPDELPNGELWTAEEVAKYTGQSSPAAARMWLSRNRVTRVTTRAHKDSGRPQALYPANAVRAAAVRVLRKADA
jgi:hypothetical protein